LAFRRFAAFSAAAKGRKAVMNYRTPNYVSEMFRTAYSHCYHPIITVNEYVPGNSGTLAR
jgi:hypothetical protein